MKRKPPKAEFICPPTPERGAHDEIKWLESPVAGVMVPSVKSELKDALYFYRNAGHLGGRWLAERRWASGMRLRWDYMACGRDKSVIMRYGEFISGTGHEQAWSDIREAAEKRYGRAGLALGREGLLSIIITVACHGVPVGHPGAASFTGSLDRMGQVRRGLDILRECY